MTTRTTSFSTDRQAAARELSFAEIATVSAAAAPLPGDVVIVDCLTRPPFGGYPPGTIVWNPWINPTPPTRNF